MAKSDESWLLSILTTLLVSLTALTNFWVSLKTYRYSSSGLIYM